MAAPQCGTPHNPLEAGFGLLIGAYRMMRLGQ